MVLRNPPWAEPEKYPGGVKTKPPFEMGVGDLVYIYNIYDVRVKSLIAP